MSNSKSDTNRQGLILLLVIASFLGITFVSSFILKIVEQSKYPLQRSLSPSEINDKCASARGVDSSRYNAQQRKQESALEAVGVSPDDPVTFENFDRITVATASTIEEPKPNSGSSFWCEKVAPGSVIEEYLKEGEVFLKVIDKGEGLSIEEAENKKTFDVVLEEFPIESVALLSNGLTGRVIGHEQGFTYGDGEHHTHEVIVGYWSSDFTGQNRWLEHSYDPEDLEISRQDFGQEAIDQQPEQVDPLTYASFDLREEYEYKESAVLTAENPKAKIKGL